MQSAPLPNNELERLEALFDYHVLDTEPEEAFDSLTQLAATICNTPIALVSLIDEERQWFKSHHGLDATETPRELAFCAHAIHEESIFEIPDSRKDARFADNPLVTDAPKVIFYAGAPLTTPSGHNIGTLCVIDNTPSKLSDTQKNQLNILAKQVVSNLELRKSMRIQENVFSKLVTVTKKLEQRNEELSDFSSRAAHDLKGPIHQISQLATFCIDDIRSEDLNEVPVHCEKIITRCGTMTKLIHDILELARADTSIHQYAAVSFKKMILLTLSNVDAAMQDKNVEVNYTIDVQNDFFSEPIRIQQILYNLVSNSIKYSNPEHEKRFVDITIGEKNEHIIIIIKDNGLGIPSNLHDRVFNVFERFHPDQSDGTGLGMAIVKKHVYALNGAIDFLSDSTGSVFTIQLPKNNQHIQ